MKMIHDIEVKEIIRSKRKTLALEINKNGELIVRAPIKAKEEIIAKLIKEKSRWIKKHKSKMLEKAIEPKMYVDGEIFYYRGKEYPLKIVDNNTFAIYFNGEEFQLDRELINYGKDVFGVWYKRQAMSILIPRAYQIAEHFGWKLRSFRLSNAEKRWGSCSSKGSINLSWKLIMVPEEAADYVIIHELAHLKYLDHSDKFWQLVEKMMPDYRIHLNHLKENSNKYDL